MKNLILWLMITGLLLLNVTNGYATTQIVKPDYQKSRSEFEKIQKSAPGVVLLKGEIIEINHEGILINPLTNSNGMFHLKLARNAKFYCNGIMSQWEALTPVAPGACFEAQVLVNGQREAIAVNAFYYGEECVIKQCYQNQGKLTVEVFSVFSEENFSYLVNHTARLPSGESWRRAGQVVYILFNEREEIRAVFLPD